MPNRSRPSFLSKAFALIFVLFLQLNVWGLESIDLSLASDKVRVSVDPKHNVVAVNETLMVNVSIANVPKDGLYSYEFRLKYDNIVLEGLDVTLPEGHFLTPEQPDKIFVVECGVNQTEGMVCVAVTLTGISPAKVGNGTLVTITFKAKTPGISTLSFPFPYPILVPPYSIWHNVGVFQGFVIVVSPDLNSDGEVNIEDLVIVATAFTSYPGHPRWNILADVNKDNVINIVDIALIARNLTLDEHDINRDGKVNIIDISIVAKAFDSYPAHKRWNPDADLNHDGKINILDILAFAKASEKPSGADRSIHRSTTIDHFIDVKSLI